MQKRSRPNVGLRKEHPDCRSVPEQDLWICALSFRHSAKKLAEAFQSDPFPFMDYAAYPVVFMYRHALELSLKALVLGEGGNVLTVRPDSLLIYKTHSVCRLAQFVTQIVTGLGWGPEFKCQGVENLADFKAVIEDVNAVDPESYAFSLPDDRDATGPFSVPDFARKMDSLLDLLNSTVEAIAAEWNMRSEVADAGAAGR